MVCSSGAESARYTFFLWLIAFMSRTVLSEKSDSWPQSHSKDDGKISLGMVPPTCPSVAHSRTTRRNHRVTDYCSKASLSLSDGRKATQTVCYLIHVSL